jgi:flagellar biosynthesis regulator FlaF
MQPFRQLQYKYHRQGLDEMSNNVDRGRTAITEAIEMLDEAHDNKPLSELPSIFSDYKRDEIVSIFSGQGSSQDREKIYDILFRINPSQNNYWEKLKQ